MKPEAATLCPFCFLLCPPEYAGVLRSYMSIWKSEVSLKDLNAFNVNTMVTHLGIEIIEMGADYIKATMPVDSRTHQPMGLLHGGASVVLAETVGSTAANLAVRPGLYCVGLEINANHIRSVKTGVVTGVATPVHIGNTTQVWNIRISDEKDRVTCVCRLTMAVMSHQGK